MRGSHEQGPLGTRARRTQAPLPAHAASAQARPGAAPARHCCRAPTFWRGLPAVLLAEPIRSGGQSGRSASSANGKRSCSARPAERRRYGGHGPVGGQRPEASPEASLRCYPGVLSLVGLAVSHRLHFGWRHMSGNPLCRRSRSRSQHCLHTTAAGNPGDAQCTPPRWSASYPRPPSFMQCMALPTRPVVQHSLVLFPCARSS